MTFRTTNIMAFLIFFLAYQQINLSKNLISASLQGRILPIIIAFSICIYEAYQLNFTTKILT